jgi:hypothetical protein
LVIRGDLPGRGNEDAGLPRPLVLDPAVEEVRDVGVLLRLRDVELAKAPPGEHLGHRPLHVLLCEGDRAREVVPVTGHRRQIETVRCQPFGELARPVRTEVEEDRRVLACEARPGQNDRLEELVGDFRVVTGPNRGHGLLRLLPLAGHDRREGTLCALPAAIAVHRVIAAHDGDDPRPFGDELGEVVGRRRRGDVAAVGEGMHVGALLHPLPARELDQGAHVIDMRVNAAVRDEPEEMDIPIALSRPLERASQRRILEERAVLDGLVYPHQILEDDATGSDRQVADLGVAHLPRRQPDGLPRSLQGRVRIAPPEPVEDGRLGKLDRVPRARRGATPAVEDDERYERVSSAAVSQIAVKDSRSSEAPPTSAPSTPGCERSSSAFSGLTEPP